MLLNFTSTQPKRILVGLDIASTYLAFERDIALVFFFSLDELNINSTAKDKLLQLKEIGLKQIYVQDRRLSKNTEHLININIKVLSSSEYRELCKLFPQTINV